MNDRLFRVSGVTAERLGQLDGIDGGVRRRLDGRAQRHPA